jgi:REP element-mobilizing transposase RayT
MTTYTQILYHIIFSTKNRQRVITRANREVLLKYIWGLIKNRNCHLFRINAVEDHIHILTSLHPTVSLSDLIKDIKISTNKFIKENNLFPRFENWQEGYAAFTISYDQKDKMIEYIKNQEEHHRKMTFQEECERFFKEYGIKYDKNYLL